MIFDTDILSMFGKIGRTDLLRKLFPKTSLAISFEVYNELLRAKELVYGREGIAPRGDEIGIHAIRGGDIIGDHLVLFAGDGERIEIKHQAHSRQAFAGGAIRAARWAVDAPIGVHGMEEVLGFLISAIHRYRTDNQSLNPAPTLELTILTGVESFISFPEKLLER